MSLLDDGPARAPLKLHLHLVPCGGEVLHVLLLRPSCGARFSNNFYHDTWHLLGDPASAAVLARLLWGLAYQRVPGTLIALGPEHLLPTPFEADRPSPVVLACTDLASPTAERLAAVARYLRHPGRPAGTVKLQTFGLAAALAAGWPRRQPDERVAWTREHMTKREGVVCYGAPAAVLRSQAVVVHRMRRFFFGGQAYTYLAEGERSRRSPEGEVQVFSDFRVRVALARRARARVLPHPEVALTDDAAKREIWSEVERLRERTRTAARRRRARAAQSSGLARRRRDRGRLVR